MKPLRQVSLNKRYVYYFMPVNVQLRLNRYGGCFDNGRPLPEMQRERVLDLYHDGFRTPPNRTGSSFESWLCAESDRSIQ